MDRSNQRVQPPQVNLKERIAALQQHNASAHHRQPSQASNIPPSGLRDKIAQFERKGAVPAPRGSFGLGAPPVAGSGQPRRTGELYGNRIPLPLRSASGNSLSRSTSPLLSGTFTPTGRSRSPSVDGEGVSPDHSHSFSGPPSSPSSPVLLSIPTSPTSPTRRDSLPAVPQTTPPRKEYFTQALQVARRNSLVFESPTKRRSPSETFHVEPPSPLFSQTSFKPVSLVGNETQSAPMIPEDTAGQSAPASSSSQDAPFAETQEEMVSIAAAGHGDPQPPLHSAHSENVPTLEPHDSASSAHLGTPNASTVSIPATSSPDSDAFKPSNDVSPTSHVPEIRLLRENEGFSPVLAPLLALSSENVREPDKPLLQETSGEAVGDEEVIVGTARVSKAEERDGGFAIPQLSSTDVTAPTDVVNTVEVSTAPSTLSMTEAFLDRTMSRTPKTENSEVLEGPQRSLSKDPVDQDQKLDIPIIAGSSLGVDLGTAQGGRPASQRPPSIRSTTSTSRNSVRVSSRPHSRTNAPVVNVITPRESVPAATQPSSESAGSGLSDEPYDFLSDYARMSVALDGVSFVEDHHVPDKDIPSQLSAAPSNTLTASALDVAGSRHTKKSAPLINIVTPTDLDALSVRTAPPAPIGHWPSTSESHESTYFEDGATNLRPGGSEQIHSSSYPQPDQSPYAEPEFSISFSGLDVTPTFTAVVHNKVTELPSSTLSPIRDRRQASNRMSRIRRPTNGVVDLSQSVGYGDLQVLVQDAVLLEQMLEEGQEQRGTARAFLDTPPKGSRHPDKGSIDKKSKSASKKGEQRHKPFFHRALSSPSATKAVRSRSTDVLRDMPPSDRPLTSVPPDNDANSTDQLGDLPPRSHQRYFSSIRKLAAVSNVVPAIFPRKSRSTSSDVSSEESTALSTPPDQENPYSLRRNRTVSSNTRTGSLLSVEISPKKALSRATTFAEKLWKRSRTSSMASHSDAGHTPAPLLLPPLAFSPTTETHSPSSMSIPGLGLDDRPESWNSKAASASSSSSRIDGDLFDSFPRVPQGPPLHPYHVRPSSTFTREGANFASGSSTFPQRRSVLERGRYEGQPFSTGG